MDLEKHRLRKQRDSCADCRVETLEVPDLNNASGPLGDADDLVGLGQRRGQRFLDEHIDAGLHQLACDLQVLNRRHDDRRCIHASAQLAQRQTRGIPEFAAYRSSARRIRISNRRQLYAVAFLLELAVDTRVVAPESARADYGNPDFWLKGQGSLILRQEAGGGKQEAGVEFLPRPASCVLAPRHTRRLGSGIYRLSATPRSHRES